MYAPTFIGDFIRTQLMTYRGIYFNYLKKKKKRELSISIREQQYYLKLYEQLFIDCKRSK